MRAKEKMLGTTSAILSATLYGFNAYFALFAYEGGSNPITFTFFSSLLCIPITIIPTLLMHVPLLPSRSQLKWLVIDRFFGTVTTLLLFSAFSYIASGIATVLHFTYPVYVAMASVLFLHKKLTIKKGAALVISLVGIGLISDLSGSGAVLGFVLALLSGITYTAYVILMEKSRLDQLHPLFICFHMAWIRIVTAGIFGMITCKIVVHMTAVAWGATAVQAFLSLFLATMLFQVGIRFVGGMNASVFSMFEPLTCLVVGILLLGEDINRMKIAGCAMIMAGIALVIQDEFSLHKDTKKIHVDSHNITC